MLEAHLIFLDYIGFAKGLLSNIKIHACMHVLYSHGVMHHVLRCGNFFERSMNAADRYQ